MKWTLVIALLFLQLFGLTNEAKASAQTNIERQNKKPSLKPSSFDFTHPADLTPVNHFSPAVFKGREYRLLPGLVNRIYSATTLFVPQGESLQAVSVPLFYRLTRLLLFPKHHFW